ncbi:EfeM/EfeO family lipoprotein [Subtercola sp. PAMC28395]|uniref:EfeM/EfeO family lipoprotein n=1 Tax=Subtercola sp. PAMC28395 TaxID=2846775 RepID=UPI001C0BF7EC|nr:EfeM/EfeO family lipoprotein [Subtercola sp. PAMC28395]QWT23698.1 EfeM/EfeO family lipoprotein [Subtercola sp. PAMC28395]
MKKHHSALALIAVAVTLVVSGCTAHTSTSMKSAAQPVTQAQFITLQLRESTSDFALYLRQQAEQLDGGTAEFAAAFQSGDTALAQALYAPTRMFYNRMLVARSEFSDLAARIDGPDPALGSLTTSTTAGTVLNGWQAIESDLYPVAGQPALTVEQRTALATALTTDTHSLSEVVYGLSLTTDEQTAGAAALIATLANEAASGTKDSLSKSAVSDLQGYVDGARVVFDGIRAVLVTQDAALATRLDHQFAAVQDALNSYRVGVTFMTYDQLTESQARSLRSDVADLAASLARVEPTMGL